jgi:hypothetical protein
VQAGDKAALAPLYSTHPPAKLLVGKTAKLENLEEELQFGASLRSSGLTNFRLKVLSLETVRNQTRLVLRVQAVQASQPVLANMAQVYSMAGIWPCHNVRISILMRPDACRNPPSRILLYTPIPARQRRS